MSEEPKKRKYRKKDHKEWILNVKNTFDEKEKMQKIADKHFAGNLSAMVRYCIFNWDFKNFPPPKM